MIRKTGSEVPLGVECAWPVFLPMPPLPAARRDSPIRAMLAWVAAAWPRVRPVID